MCAHVHARVLVWDTMQSRLRKKGSIPLPTLTDPNLARPGQVLEVMTNVPTLLFSA